MIDLRAHVSDEISLHTADTLKHNARDDSGNTSSPADSGTDSFDRDFALSLVSSEQDALIEIEEAILRIKDGSYGVCEITNKAIPSARLSAVRLLLVIQLKAKPSMSAISIARATTLLLVVSSVMFLMRLR